MKTKNIIITSLLLLTTITGLTAGDAKAVAISAFDTMKFSVTKIEAKPGEKITVTLRNDGNIPKESMGHNWILLKAGVDPMAYANSAATAKAENYQPKSQAKQVLASIPILGPKESKSVTFSAPSASGSYPFVCSFPGHTAAGMKGVLLVK